MQISAAGNKTPMLRRYAGRCPHHRRGRCAQGLACLGAARRQATAPLLGRSAGFTLLELLLVLALIAMVTGGATLALRDTAQGRLETEGVRLAALLEAARAQSRMLGVPVLWQPQGQGFAWQGLPQTGSNALPNQWLIPGVLASQNALLLGPEPLIAPASVRLSLADAPNAAVVIATDGLRPFAVQAALSAPQ